MSETEAEAEKEKVVDITEDEEIDFGSEARKIINALNVLGNRNSMTVIVLMLKGHKNKSIWDKHTRAQVYGSGKDKTPAFWTSLVRELVSLRLLKEIKQTGLFWNKFRDGVVKTWIGFGITYKGHQFFRSNEKLMMKATGDLKPKQRRNHSDYKLLCDRCGYMTKVKSDFNSHVRRMHPEYVL